MPAGSPRYWSWLFAAPAMREPLLGVYALLGEWRALIDPAGELAAAYLKLAWWREEIERLGRGAPVHPIGRYLASLPRAGPRAGEVDFTPLDRTLEATARQIGGAPLERAADLEAHASDLWAGPLAVAANFAGDPPPAVAEAVHRAQSALAAALYLDDAISSYRQAARFGRVVFPVDELLAANIENADLCAAEPPVIYNPTWRSCAAARSGIARGQAPSCRAPSTGRCGICWCSPRSARGARAVRRAAPLPLRDLYLAWSTARRAARRS